MGFSFKFSKFDYDAFTFSPALIYFKMSIILRHIAFFIDSSLKFNGERKLFIIYIFFPRFVLVALLNKWLIRKLFLLFN